jgi:hypothetical protein
LRHWSGALPRAQRGIFRCATISGTEALKWIDEAAMPKKPPSA